MTITRYTCPTGKKTHALDQRNLRCLLVTAEKLDWKKCLFTLLGKQLQLVVENQDADYWQTHK